MSNNLYLISIRFSGIFKICTLTENCYAEREAFFYHIAKYIHINGV